MHQRQAPATGPALVPDAAPVAAGDELAAAPDVSLEAVAALEAPAPAPDLSRLDAIFERTTGAAPPPDPATADRAAVDGAELRGGAAGDAAALFTVGDWTEERLRGYLQMLVNPKLIADGKEPLTPDELEEGARIGARICTDLFGSRVINNPWVALLAWAAFVIGTRYFVELLQWFGNLGRWSRRGFIPAPAPAPAPAADDAPTPYTQRQRAALEETAPGWRAPAVRAA